MPTLCLVTVVFQQDLALLYLQAVSLAKNWRGDPHWHIIVEDTEETLDTVNQVILPLMQGWQITVSRPDLGANHYESGRDGWWRQQSLKFWAAEHTHCQVIVILDAKNILMRPIDNSYFWLYGSAAVYENQARNRGIMEEFWLAAGQRLGIDPMPMRVTDTTPWVWPREQVMAALNRVQELGISHNNPQWQRQQQLLEFQTVWLLRHDRYRWHRWHHASVLVYWHDPEETEQQRDQRLAVAQAHFNQADAVTAFWTQHRRDLHHAKMHELLRSQCDYWDLTVDWQEYASLCRR